MIQQLNSVDQYCCLFHIVHQHTQVLLSKEATVCGFGGSAAAAARCAAAPQPRQQEFRAFGGAAAGPRGTLLNAGAAGEVIGSKEPRRGGAAAGAARCVS
jgi:hypothetical protein